MYRASDTLVTEPSKEARQGPDRTDRARASPTFGSPYVWYGVYLKFRPTTSGALWHPRIRKGIGRSVAARVKAASRCDNAGMLKAWSFIWRWIGNLLRVKALWELLLPAGGASVLTGYLTWTAHQPVWIIALASVIVGVVVFLVIRRFQSAVPYPAPHPQAAPLPSSQSTHGEQSPIAWTGSANSPAIAAGRDVTYQAYLNVPPAKEEPQIIAHWEFCPTKEYKDFPHFRLLLQNTGKAVAVNISALPMRFDIPEGRRATVKRIVEASLKQAGNSIAGEIDDYSNTRVERVTGRAEKKKKKKKKKKKNCFHKTLQKEWSRWVWVIRERLQSLWRLKGWRRRPGSPIAAGCAGCWRAGSRDRRERSAIGVGGARGRGWWWRGAAGWLVGRWLRGGGRAASAASRPPTGAVDPRGHAGAAGGGCVCRPPSCCGGSSGWEIAAVGSPDGWHRGVLRARRRHGDVISIAGPPAASWTQLV